MAPAQTLPRTPGYKPGLAAFSAIAATWVFVLVTLGAFTTSIGAGMAFKDWPLSNGSLNPQGWLTNIAMFAEHSHRLSAGLMTILTGILAYWAWRTEARAWLRKLTYFAAGLVVAQAVVGGLRVRLDPVQVAAVDTSLGRLFAMLHACMAQAFACTLIAVAVSCSRSWIARPNFPVGAGVRTGRGGLLRVHFPPAGDRGRDAAQLCWARDSHLPLVDARGRAPPRPLEFPGRHQLRPPSDGLRDHGCHRVPLRSRSGATGPLPLSMRTGASALVSLVAFQILLGAAVIRTLRDPMITTGHVLVGALTLVTAFWLTWLAHRNRVERMQAP